MLDTDNKKFGRDVDQKDGENNTKYDSTKNDYYPDNRRRNDFRHGARGQGRGGASMSNNWREETVTEFSNNYNDRRRGRGRGYNNYRGNNNNNYRGSSGRFYNNDANPQGEEESNPQDLSRRFEKPITAQNDYRGRGRYRGGRGYGGGNDYNDSRPPREEDNGADEVKEDGDNKEYNSRQDDYPQGRDAVFSQNTRGRNDSAPYRRGGQGYQKDWHSDPANARGGGNYYRRNNRFQDDGYQRGRYYGGNGNRGRYQDQGYSYNSKYPQDAPEGEEGEHEPKPTSVPKEVPKEKEPATQQPPAPGKKTRVQRAPHLRRNCKNDREIEELFEVHHNRKDISLENYSNIPVDIVPKDITAVETFDDLCVQPALAENIQRCGYKMPTPVQRYGIPVCLKGSDLMACAQTGSGKTAAFLIPVVEHILVHGVSPAQGGTSCPIALVFAPTRELALQIYDEVRKLTYKTDIFYDVVYGGTPYPTKFENDILVACPGRLKDIFDRRQVSFQETRFLILDEADRMLEMGFEEQIDYLVASRYTDMPSPDERQTLMFSATFPERILKLAKRYLRRQYYLLTIGRVGSTTKNIKQVIEYVDDEDKYARLFEIICGHVKTDLVLVFVETKKCADELHHSLKQEGIPSATIHGDRRQVDRERALRDFKEGITPILVATDVAARGLDIPNVSHVIQYDLPSEMDDYTHRIGRTGRAGNKGTATCFYNKKNNKLTAELYNYFSEHDQAIPGWFMREKEDLDAKNYLTRNLGSNNRRTGGLGSPTIAPSGPSNATWGEISGNGRRTEGIKSSLRKGNGANIEDGGF